MEVAILGCGYVGTQLGRQLLDRGHTVIGIRPTASGCEELEAAGLSAVCADVTDEDSLATIPDVDWLVFTASSGGGGPDAARAVYVNGLQTVVRHFGARASTPDRLVYTSSTGVYGDHGGDWVDETTPVAPVGEKGAVLAEAESVVRSQAPDHGIDGTVVRLAGIYGPDRYRLDRYLSGPVTEGYLNMIHRDDAAGIIRYLLETDQCRNGLVLGVDDEPVDRRALATWLANQCGVDPPKTITKKERRKMGDLSARTRRRLNTAKRCSNERLRELGHEYVHPTYRSGYQAAIEAYAGSDCSS